MSVPNIRFSAIWDFPYLKRGIREIQARLGIENIKGGGMPKITIRITGLYKTLGGDYGIELPLSSGTAYYGFLCYVYFSYLPFYTRD